MIIPPLDYYVDAKRPLQSQASEIWDVFISAYNDSDRVQQVFGIVQAVRKVWWILPEYRYSADELPAGAHQLVVLGHSREADLIITGLEETGISSSMRVCVDITGFMRHHILFLMYYLKKANISQCDFLYTEPEHYTRKAETAFSLEEATLVREVEGYVGQHDTDMSNDILILGTGYDHTLVSRVILSRENARLVQLHGLPSLSADMYHESLLRIARVSSTSGSGDDSVFFSSANDPFVTASTLSQATSMLHRRRPITNLYLCSLATKPQAVGFGLFYLKELEGTSSSIVFPYIESYSRETSQGRGRSWVYPIVL